MENVKLFSDKVWVAENETNGNFTAKFAVCDFGVNGNGVQLERGKIENWMASLVNQPLTGRIRNGDFTGHNPKKSLEKNDDGTYAVKTVYDTDAFGTFKGVGIEDVDGTECIVATAEIWRRFPTAARLILRRIEDGVLQTSWEIKVNEYHMSDGVKVIDDGVFTALTMLGKTVQPAYESSRLLEVAECEYDEELTEAVASDLKENNMNENETIISTEGEADAAPDVKNEDASAVSEELDTSSLTDRDLRERIQNACREKLGKWCWVAYMFPEENTVWVECEGRESELDYMFFLYSVEGDAVSVDEGTPVKLAVAIAQVNNAIAEKDSALAEAANTIASLNDEIGKLGKYKDAYETAEAQRLEEQRKVQRTELTEYAAKSGLITAEELASDSELAKMVHELDRAGINQIIAERFMAKASAAAAENSKESTVTASLEVEDVKPAKKSIIQAYLGY